MVGWVNRYKRAHLAATAENQSLIIQLSSLMILDLFGGDLPSLGTPIARPLRRLIRAYICQQKNGNLLSSWAGWIEESLNKMARN